MHVPRLSRRRLTLAGLLLAVGTASAFSLLYSTGRLTAAAWEVCTAKVGVADMEDIHTWAYRPFGDDLVIRLSGWCGSPLTARTQTQTISVADGQTRTFANPYAIRVRVSADGKTITLFPAAEGGVNVRPTDISLTLTRWLGTSFEALILYRPTQAADCRLMRGETVLAQGNNTFTQGETFHISGLCEAIGPCFAQAANGIRCRRGPATVLGGRRTVTLQGIPAANAPSVIVSLPPYPDYPAATKTYTFTPAPPAGAGAGGDGAGGAAGGGAGNAGGGPGAGNPNPAAPRVPCDWTGYWNGLLSTPLNIRAPLPGDGGAVTYFPDSAANESARITMQRGCWKVGIGAAGAETWLGDAAGNILEGDGFRLIRRDNVANPSPPPVAVKTFAIEVRSGATPGPRTIRSQNNSGLVQNATFTIQPGSRGFCCRNPGVPGGEACAADVTADVCQAPQGDRPFYGPGDRLPAGVSTPEEACNSACGVLVQCCTPADGVGAVGAVAQRTAQACRAPPNNGRVGRVVAAGVNAEALAQANCNPNNLQRYYCDPTVETEFWDDDAEEWFDYKGLCRRIDPDPNVIPFYQPAPNGPKYRPPVLQEYDSFATNFDNCSRSCGTFYCVYDTVGANVQRRCTNQLMPIAALDAAPLLVSCPIDAQNNPLRQDIGGQRYLFPPFCPAANIDAEFNAANVDEKKRKLRYTRFIAGPNRLGFNTEAACQVACTPCVVGVGNCFVAPAVGGNNAQPPPPPNPNQNAVQGGANLGQGVGGGGQQRPGGGGSGSGGGGSGPGGGGSTGGNTTGGNTTGGNTTGTNGGGTSTQGGSSTRSSVASSRSSVRSSSSSRASSVKPVGCILVTKEALDPGGGQITPVPDFSFSLDGKNVGANDSVGSLLLTDVAVGSRTVREVVPPGWKQVRVIPAGGTVQVQQIAASSVAVVSSSRSLGSVSSTRPLPGNLLGLQPSALTAQAGGCNSNGICESGRSETWENCRTDCGCGGSLAACPQGCEPGEVNRDGDSGSACVMSTGAALPSSAARSSSAGRSSSRSFSSIPNPARCVTVHFVNQQVGSSSSRESSAARPSSSSRDSSSSRSVSSAGVCPAGDSCNVKFTDNQCTMFPLLCGPGFAPKCSGSCRDGICSGQCCSCAPASSSSSAAPPSSSSKASSSAPSFEECKPMLICPVEGEGQCQSIPQICTAKLAGDTCSTIIPNCPAGQKSQCSGTCGLKGSCGGQCCICVPGSSSSSARSAVSSTPPVFEECKPMLICPVEGEGQCQSIPQICTAKLAGDTCSTIIPNCPAGQKSQCSGTCGLKGSCGGQCCICVPGSSSSSAKSSSAPPSFGCIDVIKEVFSADEKPILQVPQFTFKLDGKSGVQNIGNRLRFPNVSLGIHTITEDPKSGWTPVSVQPISGIVNVTVDSDEICATVTFQNRELPGSSSSVRQSSGASSAKSSSSAPAFGCVDVVKEVFDPEDKPVAPVPQFTFKLDSKTGVQNIGSTLRFPTVPLGIHTITEDSKAGWIPVSVEPVSGIVNVLVDSDTICAKATFQNKQVAGSSSSRSSVSSTRSSSSTPKFGCIDVMKEAFDPDDKPVTPVPQFTFKLDSKTGVQNIGSTLRFPTVPFGIHTVTEDPKSGWIPLSVAPVSGIVHVSVESDEICAKVTFQNRQLPGSSSSVRISSGASSAKSSSSTPPLGCIDVIKEVFDPEDQPISQVPQFTFKLDSKTGVQNIGKTLRFPTVPLGIHTITEDPKSGWIPLNVEPVSGIVEVTQDSNTICAKVTFQNKQVAGSSSSRSQGVSSRSPSSSSRQSSSSSSSFKNCPVGTQCTIRLQGDLCQNIIIECQVGQTIKCQNTCGVLGCSGQCCECVNASSSSRQSSSVPPASSSRPGSSSRSASSVPLCIEFPELCASSSRISSAPRPSSSSRQSSSIPFQQCPAGNLCSLRLSGDLCEQVNIACNADQTISCTNTCGVAGCSGQCCRCVPRSSSSRESSSPRPSSSSRQSSSIPFQQCPAGNLCSLRLQGDACEQVNIACPVGQTITCTNTCGVPGCSGQCCQCKPVQSSSAARSSSSLSPFCIQFPEQCRSSSAGRSSSVPVVQCPAGNLCSLTLQGNICQQVNIACAANQTISCSNTCGVAGCSGQCCQCVPRSSSSRPASSSSAARSSSSIPFTACPVGNLCSLRLQGDACEQVNIACPAGQSISCSNTCGVAGCSGQCCQCVPGSSSSRPASSISSVSSRSSTSVPPICIQFPERCRSSSSARSFSSGLIESCPANAICTRVNDAGANICKRVFLECPVDTTVECSEACGTVACSGQCCTCVSKSTSSRSFSSGESRSGAGSSSTVSPFCIQFPERCSSFVPPSSPEQQQQCSPGDLCSQMMVGDSCREVTVRCPAGLELTCGNACGTAGCVGGCCRCALPDRSVIHGNAIIEGSELCDDGNRNDVDGCTNAGLLGESERCGSPVQCGSGLCSGEVCIPCNTSNECGAENVCFARRCIPPPVIGNGVREPGEACDDGNTQDGDGCGSSGLLEIEQQCLNDDECVSHLCINNVCHSCTQNDQCTSRQCVNGACVSLCGNGALDAGEECDQGASNSDVIADRCRTGCRNARCGDGIADQNEQCDDGNVVSSDGCDRLCRIEVREVVLDLPWSTLTAGNAGEIGAAGDIARAHAPAGETGPGAIAVMAGGAAAGWAWMRRRRKS